MSQTNNSPKKRQARSNYDQNDGKPGVVYILRNDAFKENWLKIGQSTRSGQKRAEEINREAGTGLPKHHVCVFEYHTADCGRAEKAIHKRLASYRKGKQEYFEVDITLAKEVIFQECSRVNTTVHQQAEKKILHAQRMQQEQNYAAENLQKKQAQDEAERLAKEKAQRTQEEQFNRMELERLKNLAEDKSRRDAALAEKIEQANRIKQAQDEAEKLTLERATTHSYDLPIREAAPSGSSWRNYANAEAVIQPKLNTARESKLFSTDLIITCTAILLITFYFIADKSKEELPPQAYSTINKPSKLPEEILLEKRKEALTDAVAEAIKKYPYLGTTEGNMVIKLIVEERDKRISNGAEPAIALTEAVALLAPKYDPHKKIKRQN